MGEHAQPPGQIAGGRGLGEGLDQRRERAVVDAPAGLGRRDREADRQVRFPDAWRAEQDHVLAAVQEAELVQALDLLALDAGLEGKVELIERLHSRQPRRMEAGDVVRQVSALRPPQAGPRLSSVRLIEAAALCRIDTDRARSSRRSAGALSPRGRGNAAAGRDRRGGGTDGTHRGGDRPRGAVYLLIGVEY